MKSLFKLVFIGGIVIVLGVGAIVGGAAVFGNLDTQMNLTSRTVRLEDASRARIELSMGHGDLRMGPQLPNGREPNEGEVAALELSDVQDHEPTVSYRVDGETGTLRVSQDSDHPRTWFGGDNSRWDVAVADQLPVDLRVDLGDADGTMILGEIDLERLHVTSNDGRIHLDLTTENPTSYTGAIDAGDGRVEILLPENANIEVRVIRGDGRVTTEGLAREGTDARSEIYTHESDVADAEISLTVTVGDGPVSIKVADTSGRVAPRNTQVAPTATVEPSDEPSAAPSDEASESPSASPSEEPSVAPSAEPSDEPADAQGSPSPSASAEPNGSPSERLSWPDVPLDVR